MNYKFQTVVSFLLGICFIVIWETLTHFSHISSLVLPSPSSIVSTLLKGLVNGFYLPHILQTFSEVFWGLVLGIILGFGGGLILGELTGIRKVFLPFVLLSQIVPKLALAPLFIVWFGFGSLPCIVMTSLICFFPMLETTITAIDNVDAQQVRLFKVLGANRFQILLHLKVTSGMPYIFSGLRVSVVLALVGAVVSEFIGASKGLGALIIVGQSSMDTPMIFASIGLITALGLCLYFLVSLLESYSLKNHPHRLRIQ